MKWAIKIAYDIPKEPPNIWQNAINADVRGISSILSRHSACEILVHYRFSLQDKSLNNPTWTATKIFWYVQPGGQLHQSWEGGREEIYLSQCHLEKCKINIVTCKMIGLLHNIWYPIIREAEVPNWIEDKRPAPTDDIIGAMTMMCQYLPIIFVF
jgi:hypothetical protein